MVSFHFIEAESKVLLSHLILWWPEYQEGLFLRYHEPFSIYLPNIIFSVIVKTCTNIITNIILFGFLFPSVKSLAQVNTSQSS